jgi:hypothetical protein
LVIVTSVLTSPLRSLEVMDLIAKILNFSDEQKEVVGLSRSKSLVASIFSTLVGPPAPAPDAEDVEVRYCLDLLCALSFKGLFTHMLLCRAITWQRCGLISS